MLTKQELVAIKAKPMRPSFRGTYLTEEERDAMVQTIIDLYYELHDARGRVSDLERELEKR
jgi:hypothetical protein